MKKIIFLWSFLLAAFFLPYPSFCEESAAQESTYKTMNISVYKDTRKLADDIYCAEINSNTYISIIPLFEKFGAQVKWDEENERIDIKVNSKRFTLYIDKKVTYIDSSRHTPELPPRVVGSHPMVPISFLEQCTGLKVNMDKAKNSLFTSTIPKSSSSPAVEAKPISSSLKKVVVIDPGHGGIESGAKYGGIHEKDLNLDVSLKLKALLEKQGIKVYMTRSTDKTVSLRDRSNFANRLNASLFISIHHNALPGNKTYSGTETLYHPASQSRGSLNGRSLASIIQNELVNRLGTKNRGIKSRPNLSVLRHSKMPSIIAEIGYMTNTNERNRLKNSAFQQKAAEALCTAVIKALNKI